MFKYSLNKRKKGRKNNSLDQMQNGVLLFKTHDPIISVGLNKQGVPRAKQDSLEAV